MSDSSRPHGLQHSRPSCPSPTARLYSNTCPLSWGCHPNIPSSVVPFSSCLQSFPASGSLQMSQLFISGSQSIGVSASTSVLTMNTQGWFPLGWTGWISLQSKGLSRVFSNTTVQNINSSVLSFLYSPTLTAIHDYWLPLIAFILQNMKSSFTNSLGCSRVFFFLTLENKYRGFTLLLATKYHPWMTFLFRGIISK